MNVDPKTVEELFVKHLGGYYFEGNMQARIRDCIREAVATGARLRVNFETGDCKIVPRSELDREVARDAEEFEKTLPASANKSRILSQSYPWGWVYEDSHVQKEFRRFCNRVNKD